MDGKEDKKSSEQEMSEEGEIMEEDGESWDETEETLNETDYDIGLFKPSTSVFAKEYPGVAKDDIPNTAEKWDEKFANLREKSKNGALPLTEHHGHWMTLIQTAKLKPDWAQAFISACSIAIETYPIATGDKSSSWIEILEAFYKMIIKEGATMFETRRVLDTAERKFANSYRCAAEYWKIILKYEKIVKDYLPNEEYIDYVVNLYKKSFSKPYYGMDKDWDIFSRWIKVKKVPKKYKVQVQEIFLQHADEVTKIEESYPEFSGKTLHHHLEFEEWVSYLLNKEPPAIDHVDILCEEQICHEKDSVCYYMIYLSALQSGKYDGEPTKETKMLSVIKRGLHLGKKSCTDCLVPNFIEHTMFTACKYLRNDIILSLINEDLMALYNIKELPQWLATRLAILNSVRILTQKGTMTHDNLIWMFHKMLQPLDQSYFSTLEIGAEFVGIQGLDVALGQLVKSFVVASAKVQKLTWQDTLPLWEGLVGNSCHPDIVIAYTEYIRENGSYNEIAESYKKAIARLEQLVHSPLSSYSVRLCILQLTSNFLNITKLQGRLKEQVSISRDFSRRLSTYSLMFNEKYNLKVAPYEICVIPVVNETDSVYVSSSQRSSDTGFTSYQSSDDQVVKQIRRMDVNEGSVSGSREYSARFSKKGFPLFVSNLNFHATENDIRKAFEEKNLEVLNIVMKTKPNGCNFGYASVYLDSKVSADFAISTFDRMTIEGRSVFLSAHRDSKKFGMDQQLEQTKPTVIFFENVPKDLADLKKLEAMFANYGHVKSITLEDKGEPANARIEFVFPSDAENAFMQWKTGTIDAARDYKLRLGFVGKRKYLSYPKRDPTDDGPTSEKKRNQGSTKTKGARKEFHQQFKRTERTYVRRERLEMHRFEQSSTSVEDRTVESTPESTSTSTSSNQTESITSSGNDCGAKKKTMTNKDFQSLLAQTLSKALSQGDQDDSGPDAVC